MKSNSKLTVLFVLTLNSLVFGHAGAYNKPEQIDVSSAETMAKKLIESHRYFFDSSSREILENINQELGRAYRLVRRRKTDEAKQALENKRAQLVEKAFDALEGNPNVIKVSIKQNKLSSSLTGPVILLGDSGAMLFRIEVEGNQTEKIQSITMNCNFSEHMWCSVDPDYKKMVVENLLPGVNWALISLSEVPAGISDIYIKFHLKSGQSYPLPVRFEVPQAARLKVTVLSDDDSEPTPAMVHLFWKTGGSNKKPSNAVEFLKLFAHKGRKQGPRASRGYRLWCVPGPFDMSISPGEWQIAVSRGLEHLLVTDTFTVEPGQTIERTYKPKRWVNMAKKGWYSGDDHIHCQILSDQQAEWLIAWAQAEDLKVANILEAGNIHRTFFRQRGFGKQYRVTKNGYTVCPGQECPRTNSYLGHTISLNTKELVRDTDKYFLYDTVFDKVHAQGGLTGYAHVNQDLFKVHRDMSINIPKGKVDFAEILQFRYLGTDLYYEFLNTGFKLTASAGSDVPYSGASIGVVRVYAYTGEGEFTADKWFDALEKGRTFVSNGPMIELYVDKAMPGDEIRLKKNKKLRVKARCWGDAGFVLPTKLEIIKHGEVIATAEPCEKGQAELSIDIEVDAGFGCWIAARAEGSKKTRAHTTPVYVVREGFRFWKFDEIDQLITKKFEYLKEVEELVAHAKKRDDENNIEADDLECRQMLLQGDKLLERLEEAKKIYRELKETAKKEALMRDKSLK